MRMFIKIVCVALFFAITSCRKVIDLKLRGSEEKYVIEGVVTNEPGTCRVFVSKSTHFNEDNHFQTVSGAIVRVRDNGAEIVLAEKQPGVYETSQVNGVPGHMYELSVQINNQLFTATCRMPQMVTLDTLFVSRGPFGQFSFPTVAYTDPVGINNGYRLVQYVNGVKDPAIFWEDDEFTDGQKMVSQLDNGITEKDDPRAIMPGDEVTIELHSVDDAIYRFWYTMKSGGAAGNINTVSPANPLTNIHGGALGYFSAHAIDRRKVIAP